MSYRPAKFTATEEGPLSILKLAPGFKSWSCVLLGPSSPAATVLVEGSSDGTHWTTLATLSLTATGEVDTAVTEESYLNHRFNVTSLTGAGTRVLLSVSF